MSNDNNNLTGTGRVVNNNKPFPLLPLRNRVLLPGSVVTFAIGRERSVSLVQSLKTGDLIGTAVQRDPKLESPFPADLHPYGTLARVRRVSRVRHNTYRLVVEGLKRFELGTLVQSDPFWVAYGTEVDEPNANTDESKLLADAMRSHIDDLSEDAGGKLEKVLDKDLDPGELADRVAAGLGLKHDQAVEVLLALDVAQRLRTIARFLAQVRSTAEMKQKINKEVRRNVSEQQRKAMLREQLKAIQKELGEDGADVNDVDELREALEDKELPEEVREAADRQLARLQALNPAQPEYNVVRTYLQWISEVPWEERAEAEIELDEVAKKLDEDHYGLEDVKRRILEHMAVMKLSGNPRGSILCFAGPPGVGKTSLGQSIADATHRPFVRIALGGVRDEAEIRGHRRTYIGALPGRIISSLKKAEVKNPVMLLDEVDKLGASWRGTPEDALLEVLDPEQNDTFTDHYMELPFDLSEVMFICTANDLSKLSPPLRDRLEIIEMEGYTTHEKRRIAREHLIPQLLAEHGFDDGALSVSDDALTRIIRDYTREPGVRQLKRELTKIARYLALKVAREGEEVKPLDVDAGDLKEPLGKIKFFDEVAERTMVPGVATGLAWTSVGGDILFIETTRMTGKGKIEITGQLGDVMQESARTALAWIRTHAEELEIDPAFLESTDIHIHVPAGAVPKDGPSAGVTILTALTSLLTGRKVRSDTAMTGEVTLRGRVLPVGGIKSKVLAAHRAGITRVVLPERSRRHVEDVPEEVQEAIEFFFVSDMGDVLDLTLSDEEPKIPLDLPDTELEMPPSA